MKRFQCHCGNRVFFENTTCQVCHRQLGFDPGSLQILALDADGTGGLVTPAGETFRRCQNAELHSNCNWLLPAHETEALCLSCRMNKVIPNLEREGNLKLWSRMESAKRRLLYSLLSLGLPLRGSTGLRFRFMEDHRRNPDVFEAFVSTGHFDNTITINIAEADDVARHAAREQMHELYRTVLGHLRHEYAHFFFGLMTTTPEQLAECREIFGDERDDYAAALARHYRDGPVSNWSDRYISAYASSHPAEDFAETFAHFLLIHDALETAHANGALPETVNEDKPDWISQWLALTVSLNEVARSIGADDPYPFVLSDPVKLKLRFIDRLAHRPTERTGG